MAQTQSPLGLKIVKAQGGPITQAPERLIMSVNSAGALVLPTSGTQGGAITVSSIFAGDPVYTPGNGTIQQTPTGIGAATFCIGTFQGVEYSDSSGKRTVSNKWLSTTGVFPGSEVWFWFTAATSADWIFEMQSNGPITQDTIGATFGWATVGTPNAVTGFSVAALDTVSGSSGNGAFQVYGLAYDPNLAAVGANNGYAPGTPAAANNNWGDPFVNVYVKLAKGQFTAAVTGF